MLFSLQAVEQRVTRKQGENERDAPTLVTKSLGPLEQHQEAREVRALDVIRPSRDATTQPPRSRLAAFSPLVWEAEGVFIYLL